MNLFKVINILPAGMINMGNGHTLVLAVTLWLTFIPAILAFRQYPDYHKQARRKLSTDIPELEGAISIDCGATEGYDDSDTAIFYKPDAGFIDTGNNMRISSEFTSQYLPQWQTNLRSFPQGARNCYTLKPEQGKNQNYMIRAYFVYGNYDGKNKPPVFDLYLGVNRWDTIELEDPSDPPFREIMHISLTDNIDVCLVNTGSGIPFISALELRLLNNSLYNFESGALQYVLRQNVNGENSIRYPDDIYDRIWEPLQLPDLKNLDTWIPISAQSTIDTNDYYHVPKQVLKTAAQAPNSSIPLSFYWGPFDDIFRDLGDGQVREFNVSLNDHTNPVAEPIKLKYLSSLTKSVLTMSIEDTKLSFSLQATNESTVPPILNAFEIFKPRMLLVKPTEPEDVKAMMDIKQVYGVIRNWQGDPCLPTYYSWEGLNCSYNDPPRIISLNLASNSLKGRIDSSLSNLKSIESLDLSNNDLTGPVPDFLAQLPSLRILNLTGNKLSGSIPQAFMEKVKNGSLQMSWDGYPNICLSDSCEANKKKKKKKKFVPLVASIGAVLVLFFLCALAFWHRKRRRQGESNKSGSLKSKNQEFTYSEIVSITNDFETVIGEGGFGKVYLGTLKNGNQVAVKVRSPSSNQGPKEFQSEAQLLVRVHHTNLVSFIGYCNKGTHMAIVYEYMANGNLRHHLSETNANVLNWQKRLQIAIDAAQGLEYLHYGCRPPIIHRDMKSTNILLNERLQGKIADFGLSRILKNDGGPDDSHIYTDAAGTPAYIDPEYHLTGKFDKRSDVYSFGVVMLELITGHRAVIRSPQAIHIIKWVRPIIGRGDVQNVVDQRLQGDFSINSAWRAVEIAMSCVQSTAIQRPDMSQVVAELKECLAIEMAP
ncbi:hypothetical protein L1049_004384 [Liquidambar formosana]|uniref:non-specific serine/threonine protein kinase n=1 Tax=Liquidambar formosana TaxID=63359 RepID=A0AAP0RNE1_LIQFO